MRKVVLYLILLLIPAIVFSQGRGLKTKSIYADTIYLLKPVMAVGTTDTVLTITTSGQIVKTLIAASSGGSTLNVDTIIINHSDTIWNFSYHSDTIYLNGDTITTFQHAKDNILDLGIDKDTLLALPYSVKYMADPGFPYFYIGTTDPAYHNRLNMDGAFHATEVYGNSGLTTGIYGYSTASYGVNGVSTVSSGVTGQSLAGGGYGVFGSGMGAGIYGYTWDGVPFIGQMQSSDSSTIKSGLRIERLTDGIPRPGMGTGIGFTFEGNRPMQYSSAALNVSITDTTYDSEDTQFTVDLTQDAVSGTKMTLSSKGNLKITGGFIPTTADTTGGATATVGMIKYLNGHFYGLVAGSPPTWKQLDN